VHEDEAAAGSGADGRHLGVAERGDVVDDRGPGRERRGGDLESLAKILLERETIDAKEFVALLDGASEEDVFGSADEDGSEPTPDTSDESRRESERETPRSITPPPRPGFAGGAAEMRSDDPDAI